LIRSSLSPSPPSPHSPITNHSPLPPFPLPSTLVLPSVSGFILSPSHHPFPTLVLPLFQFETISSRPLFTRSVDIAVRSLCLVSFVSSGPGEPSVWISIRVLKNSKSKSKWSQEDRPSTPLAGWSKRRLGIGNWFVAIFLSRVLWCDVSVEAWVPFQFEESSNSLSWILSCCPCRSISFKFFRVESPSICFPSVPMWWSTDVDVIWFLFRLRKAMDEDVSFLSAGRTKPNQTRPGQSKCYRSLNYSIQCTFELGHPDPHPVFDCFLWSMGVLFSLIPLDLILHWCSVSSLSSENHFGYCYSRFTVDFNGFRRVRCSFSGISWVIGRGMWEMWMRMRSKKFSWASKIAEKPNKIERSF